MVKKSPPTSYLENIATFYFNPSPLTGRGLMYELIIKLI